MPAVTAADAIARARALGFAATPIASEERAPTMVATEVLDRATALAGYRAARAASKTTGLSPILVAPEALAHADAGTPAAYAPLTVAEVLDTGREHAWLATELEAVLDRLGEITDADPMTILHRIPLLDVAAVESGEIEDPLDEANLLPDDVTEAYRQQLAERAQLVAGARGGTILASQARTPNEAAALDELGLGAAHLVLVAAPPALTLLHLGFGGFNDCPAPAAHARLWEHWFTRHGAEPVFVQTDRLSGILAHPIATRAELVRIAEEAARYDPELLAEGPLYLLATLYRNASFEFWWD